ncbi:hypothetical protein [Streptomyces clavifer]|uniref:hypothetical protein n=1 Tax=Streptomyces clavifer TaxID=68188 RepID=UPI003F4B7C8C
MREDEDGLDDRGDAVGIAVELVNEPPVLQDRHCLLDQAEDLGVTTDCLVGEPIA